MPFSWFFRALEKLYWFYNFYLNDQHGGPGGFACFELTMRGRAVLQGQGLVDVNTDLARGDDLD